MRMPTAIFFSVCVLAAAIYGASVNTAQSQARGAGYMLASGAGSFVWRINTVTGAVSYCIRRDNSTDETLISSRPPYCSAATEPAKD